MRNSFARFLAAVLMISGLFAVGAAPASAALSNCDIAKLGNVCWWPQANGGGNLYYAGPGSVGACYQIPGPAVSVKNLTSRTIRFYSGTNCTGQYRTVTEAGTAGSTISNLYFEARSKKNLG